MYSNHKIAIRADAFPDPDNTNRKLVIEIGTKGIFGDFYSKSRKVANLSLGATTTTTMGKIGSGNISRIATKIIFLIFCYFFS